MQATGPVRVRRELIEPCPELSLRRQCELVGISRSGFYYEPVPESEENLALMRRLDELHLEHPVYGSRRLTALLAARRPAVNRKRVARLLQLMGMEAIYPKRNLSQPGEGHRIYPYLLEGLEITRSGPGLVQRHHVCADGLWVHVFGGGDGLVESVCAGLGADQQAGQRVLHSGLGVRWPAAGDR